MKSTILDVATDIVQITGRIRNENNPFKDTILHIYSPSEKSSRIEFEEELNKKIAKAKSTVEACEALSPHYHKVIAEKIRSDDPEELAYYNEAENKVELDELKIAHMRYKFNSVSCAYTNGISLEEAYIKAGYDETKIKCMIEQIKNMVAPGGGIGEFQQFYLIYSAERKKSLKGRSDLAKDIEQQHDIIQLAYDYLGDQEVERLKYNEVAIRKMVHYKLPATQAAIKAGMKQTFEVGSKYSLSDIKLYFKQLFKKLQIEISPKATLIKDYYRVKPDKVRDEKNHFSRKDGYKIVKKLFLIFGIRKKAI